MSKVFLVAGARPNFMKIAPLYKHLIAGARHRRADRPYVPALRRGDVGQCSSGSWASRAAHLLTVGSVPHGAQTVRVLERFETVFFERRPAAVWCGGGDVNSTLACALATAKPEYPDGSRALLAHVEAGLRSGDRMPEEVKRVVTDAIADVLFTTEEGAAANLRRENVSAARIHLSAT